MAHVRQETSPCTTPSRPPAGPTRRTSPLWTLSNGPLMHRRHYSLNRLNQRAFDERDNNQQNKQPKLAARRFRAALIEAGAEVDKARSDGVTSLMRACLNGHEAGARPVAEGGAVAVRARSVGVTSRMRAC